MSSGVSKVEVLCPNGHRVVVNVTHGTRLIQVREECCLKQRLGSPDGFILKHNRRQLDLALPVHQLGLTNMAKLELLKTEATKEGAKVRIGLEVANEGGRFQREFDPSTSLWDVVESFEKDDGRGGRLDLSKYRTQGRSPVVVYVNEEVLGEYALQSATLKMLGIFKGSHLLKLLYKFISEEKLIEVRQKIDQERDRISRLTARAAAASAAEQIHSSPGTSGSAAPSLSTECPAASTARSEEPMDLSNVASTTSGSSEFGQSITEGFSGNDSGNAIVRNEAPGGVSSAELQVNFSSTFHRRPDDPWSFPEPPPQPLPMMMSPFAEFKFPEETKGKDIYRNEFSDVSRDDFLPCDRELVLFSLNEPETDSTYEEDVGDDFFEHTVSDLKVLQASLSRELLSIDDQPLMTQAMRNARRNAKMSSYQRFIVRFEFPDRLVLQAVFRPAETIAALYKFVKETLAEKNANFELYTTPPRIVLEDRSQTLIEAELGPLALIHFKAKSQADEASETGFLAEEVLLSMSLRAKAKEVLGRHLPPRKTGATHCGLENWGDNVAGPSTQGTPSTRGQSTAQGPSSNKVPKWFHQGTK